MTFDQMGQKRTINKIRCQCYYLSIDADMPGNLFEAGFPEVCLV